MRTERKESKSPTIFQRMATRRNWLLNFTLQKIHIEYQPDLKLSKDTLELAQEINGLIDVLKSRIDRDWKIQKKQIKKHMAKIAPQNSL